MVCGGVTNKEIRWDEKHDSISKGILGNLFPQNLKAQAKFFWDFVKMGYVALFGPIHPCLTQFSPV